MGGLWQSVAKFDFKVRKLLFSSTYTLQTGRDKQVTLKIYKSGLDHLGATHFLSLRDPCLGFNPYLAEVKPSQNLPLHNSKAALKPYKTRQYWAKSKGNYDRKQAKQQKARLPAAKACSGDLKSMHLETKMQALFVRVQLCENALRRIFITMLWLDCLRGILLVVAIRSTLSSRTSLKHMKIAGSIYACAIWTLVIQHCR